MCSIDFTDLDDFDSEASRATVAPATTADALKRTEGRSRSGQSGAVPCQKCAGTGRVRWGACFPCHGTGQVSTRSKYAKNASERAATERRGVERKAAKAERDRVKFRNAVGAERFDAVAPFLINATWSEFFSSLAEQLQAKGTLSDRQWDAACSGYDKCMAKAAERTERAASGADTLPGADDMLARFATATDKGLKRPKLVVSGLRFSLAPATGRNAGAIYVKRGDDYLGKILPTCDYQGKDRDAVASVTADLEASIIAHGRETGACAMCNRELTDPKSIERGIGPICAERYGY